jgi:hypothetical protein
MYPLPGTLFECKGNGAVYRFDALGSREKVKAACVGTGSTLMQPLLDELALGNNATQADNYADANQNFQKRSISRVWSNFDTARRISRGGERADRLEKKGNHEEEAVRAAVVRCFRAVAERQISVGDGLQVWVLRRRKAFCGPGAQTYTSTSASASASGADFHLQTNRGHAMLPPYEQYQQQQSLQDIKDAGDPTMEEAEVEVERYFYDLPKH